MTDFDQKYQEFQTNITNPPPAPMPVEPPGGEAALATAPTSPPDPAVAPAPEVGAAPAVEKEDGGVGTMLGDSEVFLNAPIAGLTRGIVKFGANSAAALGMVDQKDADELIRVMDEMNAVSVEGNLPAKIASGGGALVGQYVLPAVVGFKALTALGAAPLLASIVSESLTGLLGLSPNEENIFNMLAEDSSNPNVAAIRDLLATDPEDSNWENRSRNAAEALITLSAGEALIEGFPRLVRAGKRFISSPSGQRVLQSVDIAGDAADVRLREIATGARLQANPINAVGDVVVSAAGSTARRMARGGREATGGVSFAPEITAKNVRLHAKRLSDIQTKGTVYPGGPKNPRTVIKGPPGSNLPDFVVGDLQPEDWVARTEALMAPADIKKAAVWYDNVYGEFLQRTGNDRETSSRLMGAWMAAQQNESPANAMTNVLYMWEQLQRGVPVDQIKGKGLPTANKAALAVLRGDEISGGVGQKISDFIDAGEGRDVRSIMGNDPAGGQPFVVDVHTARDTGLVDETLLNYLRSAGYEVPDNILTDLGKGGIKGPQYENRVLFGHRLTDHLNEIGWQGKSDWKPREIQAIGWMNLTEMYGNASVGGDVASAFGRNTRRISMEAAPGEGSPAAIKYGDRFGALPTEAQASITYEVTQAAIEKVNSRLGINLGNVVHSTGGWERFTNASTVQQAIVSKEAAQAAANELGYLLQQTEVWVNTAKKLTQNPRAFAVDVIEVGTTNIKDPAELKKLWESVMAADPSGLIRGYQPIEDAAGNVGIRILIDKGGKKVRAALDAWRSQFVGKARELQYNLHLDINEAEIYKARNNWKETPDGNSFRVSGDQAGRGPAANQGGADLDIDRQELEDAFGSLIEKAEKGGRR